MNDEKRPYRLRGVVYGAASVEPELVDEWRRALEEDGARDVAFTVTPGDGALGVEFVLDVPVWLKPTLRLGHLLKHVVDYRDWSATIAPLSVKTPRPLPAPGSAPPDRPGGFEPRNW